jgi:energy-coupling factor transporter transmembrane protein EcfT
MLQQRNALRSLSGGIFLIFLALAFMIKGFFLPVLFIGLALTVLLGGLGAGKKQAAYGSFLGFIWMLGLAFCFIFGFWPWILLIVGITAILGAMRNTIMESLEGISFLSTMQRPQPPHPQREQPHQQAEPPYQSYQEGYQEPLQESYQEGGKQFSYPQQGQPAQQYEQPQAQYPQVTPPQQQ